ncbi:MAG: gamma-glutamyl-gamma-aminobutyrate hydrolase family protein, partial [Chloroflexi bacterium]|nr:gamma-glutamyl-gamma-aminobutyrate hydrolase family protein [Chloroflexota bacterium]
GTLWQDLPSQWPDVLTHNLPESSRDFIAHTVSLAPDSRLAAILGVEVSVNSYHHQAVKAVGDGFRLVGTAPDGVPEAMEHAGRRFLLAVQFHPEDLPDSDACRRLFAALVEAAGNAPGVDPP